MLELSTRLVSISALVLCAACGESVSQVGLEDENVSEAANAVGEPRLYNGYPISGLAAQAGIPSATYLYSIEYAYSAGDFLTISTRGNGDADLYVRRWAHPTFTEFDCAPFVDGSSNENCVFPESIDGVEYYANLDAFHDYNNVTLHAYFSKQLLTGAENAIINGGNATSREIRWIDVPAGKARLTVSLALSSGSAVLYGRRAEAPLVAHSLSGGSFTSVFDCQGAQAGNTKSCNIYNPPAGTYFVLIDAPTSNWTGTLTAQLVSRM